MRFLPDGPNLPDELLEERDNGNVVFLCGAGVSRPAGMPDFLGLTRYVVEELGPHKDTPLRAMMPKQGNESVPELDQIFNLLQQEYAASEIDYLIAKRLKTRRGTDVSAHETILRLSKSVDGKPQIITTNFDLLFEKAAGRRLPTYVPPTLPDLASEATFNGLVYLHGRINSRIKRGEGRQGFVVSSSDFGRAYLAEAWATRFIRDLLDQYIVVLLGYSANDPPVRYLLQGLHTRRHGNRKPIFAFDRGTEEEVQQRWRDRGVRALAYGAHPALWDTLSAWAGRADDHLAWRQRVIDLARNGPKNLAPHERGQVASLVRTDIGAKLFADADPPPPGEWLCVFDRRVRCGPVGPSFDDSQPDFDPLAEYRLDDDPPRPPSTWGQTDHPGDDLLSLRSTEHPTNTSTRLAGISHQHVAPLPSRLAHLADWIVKIAHEPVAPWWAAKYVALHPYLLGRIEWRIRRSDDTALRPAQAVWRLLIETFYIAADDEDDSPWYETRERLKTEGWTNGVLRAFERSGTPYLKIQPILGIERARPPVADWSKVHQKRVVTFEVAFPLPDEPPKIPNEVLPAVYQILRRHLELAAGLLADVKPVLWQTSTFYPEDKPGEHYLTEESAYLFWFRGLFDRMVEAQPELLQADIALWPQEDTFFFNKLRLWAWTFSSLFSGDKVADGLLSLSDKAFWEVYNRRELLHLLQRRWRDLPAGKRERLERRMVNGRTRWDREGEDDYNQSRSSESAAILGWLRKQGCELNDDTQKALPDLQSADPHWRLEWDENADESYDGRGGSIRTDSDPSLILNAPLDQIVPLAREYTRRSLSEFKMYAPFDGLVKQHLRRAVAALSNAARRDDYPVELWRSAMQNWPDGTRQRLVWLFGARLARIPSEIVFKLRPEVFSWLEKRLPALAAQDQLRALSILDVLLDKLYESEVEAVGEGSGDAQITAIPPDQSHKSFEHALGSPVGAAVELLLNLLNSRNLEKGASLPPEIQFRLERLIAAPGEGSDHAVYIIAQRLKWFDYIDPAWTRRTIVPWLNLEHSATEPAWNGFLRNTSLPEPELFSLLKPHFLEAFIHASKCNWNDHVSRRLHEFLVMGCSWHQDDPAYISFDEARHALQQTDDKGRAHSIWFLSRIAMNSKEWAGFAKPFLEKAWPKEESCKTERTSRAFLGLVREAGDLFPQVVQNILPYIVPISQGGTFVYSLTRQNGEEGVEPPRRFPDATLALLDKLVSDTPDQIPYNLDVAVEMIAEAKPSLRQDGRWRRLKDLALRR